MPFSDWRLENSRTAARYLPDWASCTVLDPPTVVAYLCLEKYRLGIEHILRDSRIAVPERFDGDLTELIDRLRRKDRITPEEAESIAFSWHQVPIRRVSTDAVTLLDWATEKQVGPKTGAYLNTACRVRGTVLSFDPIMISACRRLRVPRFRYAGSPFRTPTLSEGNGLRRIRNHHARIA